MLGKFILIALTSTTIFCAGVIIGIAFCQSVTQQKLQRMEDLFDALSRQGDDKELPS